MQNKKLSLALVVVLVLSLLLSACGQKPADEPAPASGEQQAATEPENPAKARGNILTVADDEPDGPFNPILSDSVADSDMWNLMFTGLISNDKAGNAILDHTATEKYEISEDSLTYTFYLKKGIKFHDGQELKAQDVEFTWYTMAHPDYDGPRWTSVEPVVGAQEYRDGKADKIEGIKVIDDYTISFTIKAANAAMLLDLPGYGILPKHYYQFDKWEDFKAKSQTPMGSGPFKWKQFVVGQYVELEVFPDYFEGRAKLDGIIYRNVPEESVAAEVAAGSVDIARLTANPDEVAIATETGIADINKFTGNGYTYVGFNLRNPKFKDKAVRQALAYGLNRQAFVDAEYRGFAQVANAPISPVSWAFSDKVNKYEYNPAKANELLDAAGWKDTDGDGIRDKDGVKLSLTWTAYTDSAWPANLIAVAKENWKEIGVELNAEMMEFNAVSERVFDKQEFEMYNMAWSLSIDPDPTGLFDKASDTLGGFNCMGYYNEEAEKLFVEGKKETDPEKRKAIYQRWAEIANEDLPYLFIAYREEVYGVNKRVKNLALDPYRRFYYEAVNIEVEQ